jgi:PAS domain S-box-containing protein
VGEPLSFELLDEFPNPAWRAGLDGRCEFFNRAWLDFTGRTLEEEFGAGWSEGVHPDDLASCLATYREAFADRRSFEIEYRLRRYDGEFRSVLDFGRPMHDRNGNFAGYIGFCYDITRDKQAKDALHCREMEFRSLAENSPDVIMRFDRNFRYLYANPAIERETGMAVETFLGRSDREVGMPLDLVEFWEAGLREVFATGRVTNQEFSYPAPSGRIFIEARLVPEKGESGVIESVLVLSRNITERKLAEQELQQSREELRNLSAYLEAAREEERANIAREIHDELGQELTALKMDVVWLGGKLTDRDGSLLDKTRAMARQIDETIRKVQRISTDLRPRILDDLGLAAAIEWQVREFQKRTGICCDLRCAPEVAPPDPCLSTAVFRIVQEALTNVFRHAQASRVKVNLKQEAGRIILAASDNGRGITSQELADPQSLGLVGMRERVRLLGGKISVRGIRNRGTAIRVRIPVS